MEPESSSEKTSNKRNEVTLLLLGATGAGKSTFVNAIANYLTFGSFEEALSGTPEILIPLQFTATDDDYKPRQIQMGTLDDNENLDAATSATQGARTYTFQTPNIRLRSIDTPGIGDVRGKGQDKANFESIMSHLNYIKEINGICIFLDPNNSRLTEYFTFCVDELLTHLHKDACSNIVFVFCKSRGSNYRPGDSLATLNKLIQEKKYNGLTLNKNTIYCIDNECVRLLAMHGNKLRLSETERSNCIASWEESSNAIARLIHHVSSIKPHSINSTVCLNNAKIMVYALIEPMLQICENIDKNIGILTKKKQEASGWGDGDASDANLQMPKIVLETKTVNPRLVCVGDNCDKNVKMEAAGIENFVQVCHDDCYIKGLKFLNKMTSLNRFCEVMNEGVCTVCWCSWKVHKHMTCVYEEKVVDEGYGEYSEIDSNKRETAMSIIEDFIYRLDEKVRTQECERDTIIDVAAKLGIFLEQNSIRTNSDAIVEQIRESIAFEEEIINSGGKETKKKHLNSLLEKYELQKKQLANVRVFPPDVYYMRDSLYNLPINGRTIERSVKANLNVNEKNGLKTEVVLACRGALSAIHKKLNVQLANLIAKTH